MESLAIIFDVDGVLVDSYQAHLRTWQKAIAELDWPPMTEEQFAATFGRTSREIIAELYPQQRPTAQEIQALDERKEALYRTMIRQDFPVMPGARDLIDALDEAKFLLAAGSSGPPDNVELTLKLLNRRERFRAVVTGRDVQRGKPDPQVFLVAAERLGVAPKQCAVIEDAAPGVAAARAAGMLSIGLVSTGRSRDELADADHLVDRLDQLSPQAFAAWLGRD